MATEANRERKLAVIMHADVVGSTELVHRDETIAHARITDAFRRFSEALAAYDGTVREIRGDALVAEFARASDAVSSALAAQAANAAHNATLEDDISPEMRVGIALGEVVIADETVTGPGIVLAQRLEQLAEAGGVCVQGSVYEAIPGRMPFEYTSLGERAVKGFNEPVRAFLVTLRGGGTVPQPEPNRARRVTRAGGKWTIAAAAMAVAIVGGGAWFALSPPHFDGSERPPSLGIPRLSIAVLPFTNLSGNDDQEYFADALTEDITSDLSRISGSFVISRRTAATYRGTTANAQEIARELNVHYLLEGTVRRGRSDVRVSVQLIDGNTGQQVWSERYQKAAEDMYAFQEEVTGRVARALNLELKDAISRQTARGDMSNLDASDLTLRAWAELWTKPQTQATNEKAISLVSMALDIEANNAEALGVAAYAYARAATYAWGMSRGEALEKGIAAGERSVSLDPKNADATYALAFLYYIAGDTRKSQELMRQSIALNRNHAPAYFFYGLNLIRLGHPRDAIEWVERAFALSPRDPLRSVWYGTIARAYVLIGDDAQAIETARMGTAANRKHPHNYAVLASAYAHLGRMDEARAALDELTRLQPGITVSRYTRNVTSDDPIAIKSYTRLLDGLRRAGLPAT